MAHVKQERLAKRWLAGVLACTALACGDALVDSSYQGTPLFRLEGSVIGTSDRVDSANPRLNIAILWSPQGAASSRTETLVEHPGRSLPAEYYRPFRMNVFDAPGDEHLARARSGARYGIARLVAYLDTNDNGRKDADESLLGSSPSRTLLYAPESLSATDSPTGSELRAGWYVTLSPLMCPVPPGTPPPTLPPTPVANGDCGVPLGAACRMDAECGGGKCVLDFLGPWPGGACAIAEPPPNGCRQRGSALVRSPDGTGPAYWVKGCRVPEDCDRAPSYQCDQSKLACLPTTQVPVELGDKPPPQTFCLGQGPTP